MHFADVGRQDHRQTYNRIFAIPPYVRARCSTSNSAGELNVQYRQLEPRNRRYCISDTGWSKTAGTPAKNVHAAIQNIKERRVAKESDFNQATKLRVEDLQIGDLALIH